MTRLELEHLIRASGAITRRQYGVALLAHGMTMLLASMEADLYPKNKPQLADLVDGSIGEGSHFHAEFGYYAQGVGPETATLPKGWQDRLIGIKNENTNGVLGLCLEVHDLAISKYVAGRPKDRLFAIELIRQKMVQHQTLLERLCTTEMPDARRIRIRSVIEVDFKAR